MFLVIFDADGTLIEGTKTAICCCIKDWFVQHGFQPPREQEILNEIHKADLKGVLSKLLPSSHRTDEIIELAVKEIDYSYTHFYMPKYATLVDGALEVIQWLRARDFKVAIVTNATKAMLERYSKNFGLNELMDTTISADDVERPKPNPDGILKALDLVGAKPGQAVMVGDTVTDVLAALNAEVPSIGVLTGIGSREELQEAGASYVIPSVASLPELIRSKLVLI
jgi:pyrophosphatase PpaX